MMEKVSKAIAEYTPQVQPSPYCKRWWTEGHSQLRDEYSYIKNQYTRFNRYGISRIDLTERARVLRQQYHTAIRDEKRQHWKKFLENTDNIWQAARYAKNRTTGLSPVPTLHTDHVLAGADEDKAKLLLQTFFPPLPPIQRCETTELPAALSMDPITDREIKKCSDGHE